jgi:hypothetical protein
MTAVLTETPRTDADHRSENRVEIFFVFTTCSDRVSWSQSVEAHQEIFTFDTTTASGRYPVNFVDPYGLCADDLSLSQANRHYRDGNGTPLYVDAASIRINGVYSSDFNSAGDRQLYTTKIFSKNGDFFVYGNITLEYAGNNQVNILPDNYGFEMHEGRPLRNIETKIGGFIAGEGTPYDIHFEGTVPIKPSR